VGKAQTPAPKGRIYSARLLKDLKRFEALHMPAAGYFSIFAAMISIITAIYNGLPVNRLFLEHLRKNTFHPFELIILDNGSTDGSAEFFENSGARVIRNDGNYSYPHCQNQGIEVAKYDNLAFLNNDIIVSPSWDKHLLEAAEANGLEIITTCGIEQVENEASTRKMRRKWNRIKNAIALFGIRESTLRLMHTLMYGRWERFCERRWNSFGTSVKEGFVGHSVLMKRSAIDKIGPWDDRIQSADFDLYIRSKKRSLEHGDIKPCHLALGVMNHHYIRITVRSKPPVFKDRHRLIRLEDKWSRQELEKYMSSGFFK
jgi:GT2 family glycosyltransferase